MIGRVGLADDADQFIASEELGPDALDPSFDFRSFKAALLGVKRNAKAVLMDQRIVPGLEMSIQTRSFFRRALIHSPGRTNSRRMSSNVSFGKCERSSRRPSPRARGRKRLSSECPKVRFCQNEKRKVIVPDAGLA